MIQKLFDSISKADIDALLSNQVPEGRDIEYKTALPGATNDEKKEFLADVSSFANAAGGDLLYGIIEVGGLPRDAPGVAIADSDAEILRLDNVVRDGIEPRIPAVQMKTLAGFPRGAILLMRIQKSWASPHMVKFQNLSRFYTRNNAGKYPMDVGELRSAFALSESLPQRIRQFRDDRLGRIVAGETPIRLLQNPKLVLHVLPVASFSPGLGLPVTKLPALPPIGDTGWNMRINIDGVVTFSGPRQDEPGSRGYCQVFRSGRLESVYADIVRIHNNTPFIASVAYERYIIEAMERYLRPKRLGYRVAHRGHDEPARCRWGVHARQTGVWARGRCAD